MPSKVYFADMRATPKRSFNDKLDDLIQALEPGVRIKRGGNTAIKIHFGERGNTAFIRPVLARRFVEAVRAVGARPFLTDANTLYVGTRAEATSHLVTAVENGFAFSVVNAPLIIADGLKGHSAVAVPLDLPECKEAFIGAEIVEADSLISLAHFKGHELAGFGGAIKNLGMGCASRRGKLFQHSNVSPEVAPAKCIACGDCILRCPVGAIKLVKRAAGEPAPAGSKHEALRARKDPAKCIGCGDCVLVCPSGAMEIQWDAQIPIFMRRMVAYTQAVLKGKEGHSLFFNFITNVSPACDCYPFQDAPIVADLGVMASHDPVAIDQAAADLVNQAHGRADSRLKSAHAPGADKFRDIYPKVNWQIQLDYAQQIGLGSRDYELLRV
jgi:uncharacterized Fe-S center protein